MTILKKLFFGTLITTMLLGIGVVIFQQTQDTQKTPEYEYEVIYVQKISKLFNLLLGPNTYYVNATVEVRHKEEREYRHVKKPKSILYEKETQQNSSQSTSSEAPELAVKKNKPTLPGMSDVIESSKKYEVSQTIKQKKLSLKENNNSHKEIIEEIYYDENTFETIKPKHGLEKIRLLVMVNQETLAEKGLTIDILKKRIEQLVPLQYDRKDELIIESKLLDFTPPYLKIFQSIFMEDTIQRNIQIATVIIITLAILYYLIQLILYLRHRRKKQQLRRAKAMADLEKEKLSMPSPELPMTQKVIQTIEKEPSQTQEIVEYWMEQHHDKK